MGKRGRRRSHDWKRGWLFKSGTADKVRYEILSHRQRNALLEREQHLKFAKLFGFGDGIDTVKMKNYLPAVILAQPAGLQRHAARFTRAARMSNETFAQSSESFRKIST